MKIDHWVKAKRPLLCLVLAVNSVSVYAAQDDTGQNSNNDDMVVTASRSPQPVSSVLAPTDIVTRDDIDRWQVKSVAEVMQRLPGVNLVRTGGIGQQTSLFIRGTNSSHVLLLVDGMRLNQAGISGSSDLSQIPISLVQRIEYIRGPRSAVYGSDAIGGVVNIITTREQPNNQLSAGMGSHGYQSYDGAMQQSLGGDTRLTLAGNYTYTRGYDIVANLPDNYGDPRQPDNDGFLSKMLWANLEHNFNEQMNGFFRSYGFNNRSEYDGSYSYRDPLHPDALIDTRQLYSRTYDGGFRFKQGDYASQLLVSYNHTQDYNYDPHYGPYSASATLDDSDQYNVQWGNTWRISQGMLSSGVDWQQQSTQPGTGYVKEGYSLRNTGVYLTAQQQIDAFTLEGAIRGDDNQQLGWHSTWQSSAAWAFVNDYRLILSYGTAFKAPNLGQLYGFYGNSSLKPEESTTEEVGVEGLTGEVNWRLSTYRNRISQMIDFAHNRYDNLNQATIKGVEWTGSVTTGALQHQLTLEYLDAQSDKTQQQLARRAKEQLKYQLDWQWAEIDWSLNYLYLGPRNDVDYNSGQPVTLGGASIWDLAATYPISTHIKVRARMANLFDKNYETAYGYRTPGREYYLTGSYVF